jgi:serine protease Do
MRKHTVMTPFLLFVLLISGCARVPPGETQFGATTAPPPTQTPAPILPADQPITEITPAPLAVPPDMSSAAASVSPAVVGLAVRKGEADDPSAVNGLGTGVMVHPDGYLLTNHHVAGSAQAIEVVFYDGTTVPGKRVWSDAALDLAVVRCEGGPYATAPLGDTNSLRVGQPVLAIGTPLDLSFQHTATAGIVSAVDRTLEIPAEQGVSFMEQLIQTDASINPGNSGGPLCDINGYVVGITTIKVTGAEGLGFAIPINICRPIMEKIIAEGKYVTPYMGLMAIDRTIARFYGYEVEQGITALNVDPEGPAYACGIRQGDTLLMIDGEAVETMAELRERTYTAGAGSELSLTWSRDGETMTGVCRLIERPK